MEYLDGLRGLMSINVIICHFICVYYPEMYTLTWAEKYAGRDTGLEIFASTPLSALVNGDIAVQYFFVLSGFLTAISAFKKKDIDLFQSAVGRYLRLFPMVAIATLFSFALMLAGLMFHLDIAPCVGNYDFLLGYCNFEPTICNVIYNIFFKPFWSGSDYVGPFWTICYELFGYIIVLSLCILSKEKKWRRIMYVVVAGILFLGGKPNYCSFIFGAFVADLYYYRNSETTWLAKIYVDWICKNCSLVPMYLVGIFLSCIPMQNSGLYQYLPSFVGTSVYRGAGIALCMWCIFNCGFAQRILEVKPVLWLGKISFTTYAVHWPLMLSLEAGLFKELRDAYSYTQSALVAFAITLPCIFVFSWFMWRIVESNQWISSKRKWLMDKLRG